MKFSIEQRHLTDAAGKPIPREADVSFHLCDAESADDAVRLYIRDSGAEVIGDVLKFPGFQAMATMRNVHGVYTLQVSPASGVRVTPA
ncbi:MAG: hypothetical protein AABO58_02040 [Acidobacteriota bacterium]